MRQTLAEVDFSPLTKMEALSTKGGGWVVINGERTYLLDEVPCYADDLSGIDWGRTGLAAGIGFASGALPGAQSGATGGSFLGPAGTAAGAVGGALVGGAVAAATSAYGDYVMQSNGY